MCKWENFNSCHTPTNTDSNFDLHSALEWGDSTAAHCDSSCFRLNHLQQNLFMLLLWIKRTDDLL